MKIAITADSIIDLTPELLSKYDIKIIPLNVILGGEEYYDDGSIKQEDIFDYVKKNNVLPKTAAASEGFYNERFQEILDEGYDALIHFNISSGMSVSYTNAVNASKAFNGKVRVIDSASLSTGVALQAIYARTLTETESDINVIAEKVEKRRGAVQASFIIEKLDYLHKGGRCSSTAYLFGSAMGIRPQILVKDGKMISGKKYIGRNMPALIKKYCKDTLTEFSTPNKSMCFITYSSATPEMVQAARESIKDVGFEEIYETQAGCTVTSHCGENTLGILYYNDDL
ncbi:MAG: DegV family protein [Clostridiales bacterium]|nr:DegV family protein [Clostridiales bacterium]